MKLLENIPCKKGITLNSQLVDLLSILDEDIPREEQDKKIAEYIISLKEREATYKKACEKGDFEKYKFLADNAVDSLESISKEDIEILKNIFLDSIVNNSIFSKSKMETILEENGFDKNIYTQVAKNVKNLEFDAKEGILTLTPESVRKLHSHMFKNGNKYDRVTFDNVGKYSGYVSFDGETYTPEKLDKMVEFCESHGMKSKINTFLFYADFPINYEVSLNKQLEAGEISEEDKKAILKKCLINYAIDVGKRYGDRIDTVDIFNELIYDPVMKEKGFDEEWSYHPRKEGWQKYLSLEDLCEMALAVRKEMPNTKFTYNDMNWVEPKKRKEIIKIIKEIREIEARYRAEGKLAEGERGLIDNIGVEAHLTTGIEIDEIGQTFEDIKREIDLPVEVTELDVARDSRDPLSPLEIKKQGMIFEEFMRIASERPEVEAITIWSQSDELSFMNFKNKEEVYKKVYASLLNDDFEEKDFEPSKEIELQNFNFHTHTALCGHADGTIQEYVQKAILGGKKVLGFSDHAPNPFDFLNNRKKDPKEKTEMYFEEFARDYIPGVKKVKEDYKDEIDVKIGLEVEYLGADLEEISLNEIPDNMKEYAGMFKGLKKFREELEGNLDYMILGQHFVFARDENGKMIMPPKDSPKTSVNYPLDYALTVVEAIKSGKFAYVAHPDIFLEARDKVPKDIKDDYMENAKKASEMICEAASEYGIPLEVNLGAVLAVEAGKKEKLDDATFPYPVPEFWKIAEKHGCKVLIGTDAHFPSALSNEKAEKKVKRILDFKGVEPDYLESFEPKGIGKEGKTPVLFSAEQVGDVFANRGVQGKDNVGAKIATEQKQVTNNKNEKIGQTHNDE